MIEAVVLDPRSWLVLGLTLGIADILFGAANLALAIGVACGLVSAVLFGQELEWYGTILASWRSVALLFSGFSIASVLLLRLTLRRGTVAHINRY